MISSCIWAASHVSLRTVGHSSPSGTAAAPPRTPPLESAPPAASPALAEKAVETARKAAESPSGNIAELKSKFISAGTVNVASNLYIQETAVAAKSLGPEHFQA